MLKLKILIPLSAIVILIFGIGGLIFALLFTQTWNPSWNPFSLSPQERLEKAFRNLFSAKTFKTNGFIEFEIKTETEEGPESFLISFRFSSKVDREKESPKSEGSYSLAFGGEGFEISMTGEIKTIGEDFYLKLTSLPKLPLFGKMLQPLENQWLKIDQESFLKEDLEKRKEEQKKLFEDLIEILKREKVFEVKEKLKEEKIEGEKTFHFLVGVGKEKLKKVIPEILKSVEKYAPQEEKLKIEEFLKDFPKKFEEVSEKIGEITFEIWIGKRDNYLRALKGEKEIDLSKFEQLKDSDLEKGKLKISFDIRFSLFNQEMKIEPPAEFKLLEEVFPEIGGPFLPFPLPGQ